MKIYGTSTFSFLVSSNLLDARCPFFGFHLSVKIELVSNYSCPKNFVTRVQNFLESTLILSYDYVQ